MISRKSRRRNNFPAADIDDQFMKDLLPTLRRWQEANKAFAIARVVSTWGSAPRRPGAWMAISSDGDIVGSVSGGCVEGAVRKEALNILGDAPSRIVDFGIDNESAWSVGLSCGGRLDVIIQPFPEDIGNDLLGAIDQGQAVTWITKIDGGLTKNELHVAASRVLAPMAHEINGKHHTVTQHIPRPATLLIVGGADIAVHLVQMADQVGFETILIDPRAVFTHVDRFPVQPTQLHTKWPQEVLPELALDASTFAVLLTHDPKIDDPAIALLFEAKVPYIGALGGQKTQAQRRIRLAEQGHSQEYISRIKGPVGLKINAATPAEIAVSILAEVIQVRNDQG